MASGPGHLDQSYINLTMAEVSLMCDANVYHTFAAL